jgi:hypothetical protein
MELAKSEPATVARPLHVLSALIKADLKDAKEAAEEAAAPYYQSIADKMVEARLQQTYAETVSWAHRNFGFRETQCKHYLKIGRFKGNYGGARPPSTLSEAIRATGGRPRGAARGGSGWHKPVTEAIGRVNVEALKQDALAKQQERALQRKLALSLIDIGYKALAAKLHPDKGGSREAMMRLNRVRELLRGAVT